MVLVIEPEQSAITNVTTKEKKMNKFPSVQEIVDAPKGTVLRSDSGNIYIKYSTNWLAIFCGKGASESFAPEISGGCSSQSLADLLAYEGLEHLL